MAADSRSTNGTLQDGAVGDQFTMSPAEVAAGARNGEDLIRRVSLSRVDPKAAYPQLDLSGRVISACFAIPYSVSFNAGNVSGWVSIAPSQERWCD